MSTSYDQYGFAIEPKGPRPQSRLGAGLLAGGGLVHIVAVFLPWYDGSGVATLKGLNDFFTPDGTGFLEAPGRVWIIVGALLMILGVVTFFTGRILGVAVAAAVIGVAGLFGAILGFGAVKNQRDVLHRGDAAVGLYVGTFAILVALAGAMQVLGKRRR